MKFKKYINFVWQKHQHHWNWILGVLGFGVLLMALWNRSVFMFLVSFCGLGGSFMELPDPTPPFVKIEKILESERGWLAKPWGWKKRFQLLGMVASLIFVLVACWAGSLVSLLLFVGLCVNIWCVHDNKLMGIDDL